MRISGNKIYCINNVPTEHFNDYREMFEKYFRNASHHYHSEHFINKSAIHIFSYFPSNVDCDGCSQRNKRFDIPLKGTYPDPPFFDERFRNIPCDRMHQITYGLQTMGFYCKKNNIFITTDIAHNGGNSTCIKTILDYMEGAGLIKEMVYGKEKKIEITLGTDPEMESVVDGEIVPANQLPLFSTRDKSYISHDGHHSPQRELRPDPSKSPEELVENIRDLIKISSFFGEDLSVVGNKIPLGGHIHIGGISPSKEIILILDYFLEPFNEFNSKIRKGSRYGKKGDFRSQPHGFEYRTPPSFWLLTPQLALMTLQLTKTVVEKLINGDDVEIGSEYRESEYKKNLEQFGFSSEWINLFFKEIEFAKEHIDYPLAKLWNVEIPPDYRVKRKYLSKTEPSLIPRPQPEQIELRCDEVPEEEEPPF